MDKVDLKKAIDSYKARRGEFRIINIPEMQYLMLDGKGDPNSSPDFTSAIDTLFPIAYGLKFASKSRFERDYVVPPLEGLWWADDINAYTTSLDKSQWNWTVMVMVPDWIDRALVSDVVDRVAEKNQSEAAARVRCAALAEGRCVQTLHVGSFDSEAPVLAHLHDEFIPAHGLRMAGKHHEIYFSDVRKVAPEKQRTILRQPVVPAAD